MEGTDRYSFVRRFIGLRKTGWLRRWRTQEIWKMRLIFFDSTFILHLFHPFLQNDKKLERSSPCYFKFGWTAIFWPESRFWNSKWK